MSSPVDTTVKHFTSAMPGAPVLNGVAGALISLLDACLVNGFGTKAVTTLVVAGGIATMTFAGGASAALVDSVITVSGATPAGLNGEQKVLSANATSVTFATAEANGAASGSISFKLAAAGWLKSFTGTNLAAYKSADPATTGMYLRVDDTGTMTARVVGYEAMSDVNTGTGPFPSAVQMSGGGYWAKSGVASAVAVNWILVSDARFFILWVAPLISSSSTYRGGVTRGFGDIIPFRPSGDAYACTLSFSTNSSVSSAYESSLDYGNSTAAHAFPRNFTGLGSSSLQVLFPYVGVTTAVSGTDSWFGPFPSAIDGSLRFSKRYYTATSSGSPPRGDLPGLYSVPQTLTADVFAWGDRVPGSGLLTGRNLIAVSPSSTSLGSVSSSSNTGTTFIDITGPWR